MEQDKERVVVQEADLTLVHGDCRQMIELEDGSIDLVITDPPFNVSGRHGRREFDYGEGSEEDSRSPEEYAAWTGQWIDECLRVLKPGGQLYALMSLKWLPYWAPLLKDMKWHILPWAKTIAFLHRENTYLRAWEPVLWIVKPGAKHRLRRAYTYEADKDWLIGPNAVGEAEANPIKKRHPTPRPDWVFEYFLVRGSQPGDTVLDPFVGSGTCGFVARRLGRAFVGYDINRQYVELTAQRIAGVEFGMGLEQEVAEAIPGYRQLELMQKWAGAGLNPRFPGGEAEYAEEGGP